MSRVAQVLTIALADATVPWPAGAATTVLLRHGDTSSGCNPEKRLLHV
jgi:hypothetical protein